MGTLEDLECGDLSPLCVLAKAKSGDKSPHSKSCLRPILMRFNLADAPLAALPVAFAQLLLQYLAGAAFRQLAVDDLNRARHFVTGQSRAAELDQLVGACLMMIF